MDTIWSTFVYNNQNYIIKLSHKDNYNIVLTDLANIWTQPLSQDDLLQKLKLSNPKLRCDNDTLISKFLSLVRSINIINITLTSNENEMKMILATKISIMPFEMQFDLVLSNSEMFRAELTVPLLGIVLSLRNQKDHLVDLLQKKDLELEEYKFQHGEISRTSVITEKFNKEDIENENQKCVEALTNEKFVDVLRERFQDIPTMSGAKEEDVTALPTSITQSSGTLKMKRQRKRK